MSRHHCWSSTVKNMAAPYRYTSGTATRKCFIYLFIFKFCQNYDLCLVIWLDRFQFRHLDLIMITRLELVSI